MARQEIFEGLVNFTVDDRLVEGKVVFHQPGGTFILAVEDHEVAARLVEQLTKVGTFRAPLDLAQALARAGVRHLGHEVCLIPEKPEPNYQAFIKYLGASAQIQDHRPWSYN